MMLQQTQVATVIPYYERWMARFPTIRALAEAPLDDVLKAWQGLGYYARARNLHRAAQLLCETNGGQFPTTFDAILALPGIGRYTAGAISSIALGTDTPLVDANVIRVLSRAFAIGGDPKSKETQDTLWALAEELLPTGRAGDFNQALMELGALVCGSPPRCTGCPVATVCAAYQRGETERYPEFAAKPTFTLQTDVSAVLTRDNRFLLVKRPDGGLWAGLYELPRVTAHPDESVSAAAERAGEEIVGLTVTAGPTLATLRHGVTTRKVTLHAVACTPTTNAAPTARGCAEVVWASEADLARLPLSSPQAKLLAKLHSKTIQPSLF